MRMQSGGFAVSVSSRAQFRITNDAFSESRKTTALPSGRSFIPSSGIADTGDHRVTLTWNASVPRPNVNDEDIGYCLYRSKDHPVQKEKRKTPKVAKKHPCQECEGVNTFPIRQTSCIDNVVEDDVLYYYVAIATNKNGLSEFSNQARAKIPAKAAGMPLPSGSYRLCRARDDTP